MLPRQIPPPKRLTITPEVPQEEYDLQSQRLYEKYFFFTSLLFSHFL